MSHENPANGNGNKTEATSPTGPGTLTANRPLSALESHAEALARDVSPDEPREGEKGIDFVTIITMIIGIITTIVQNCPMAQSGVKEAFKRPSLRQRAVLWKTVKENCDCCNMSRHAMRIHQSMLARSSNLSDADAQAIIQEASSDQNLLV